jgi:hypothetical protein
LFRGLTSSSSLSRRTTLSEPRVARELDSADAKFANVADNLSSLSQVQRFGLYAGGVTLGAPHIPFEGGGEGGGGEGGGGDERELSYADPYPSYLDTSATFARRNLQSIGFHESLLLEQGALCDDCGSLSPGVVCYCRSLAGCRICFSCDANRHDIMPCTRWILLRFSKDVGGTQAGVKRDRDDSFAALYQLKPNEFVKHDEGGNTTEPAWLQSRCKCYMMCLHFGGSLALCGLAVCSASCSNTWFIGCSMCMREYSLRAGNLEWRYAEGSVGNRAEP